MAPSNSPLTMLHASLYSLSLWLSLMSTFAPTTMGQTSPAPTSLDGPSPTDTFGFDPYNSIPPHADNAGDSGNNNVEDTNDGVVNYYFLLLAVFVVLVGLSYCFIARRRRRRLLLLRNNRQDALQRDLEGWQGGRSWGPGQWRATHDTRPEEGLDERGMPPPPYVPAPKPTHHGSGNDDGTREPPIPLQDLHHNDQKPPDYFAGTSESRHLVTTGANTTSGTNPP